MVNVCSVKGLHDVKFTETKGYIYGKRLLCKRFA